LAANNDQDLRLLEEVVSAAGQLAMGFFKSDNEVWMKSGNSPVSQADMAVNDYLQKHLLAVRPDYGWLSEETEDDGSRLERQRVFMVDPIDGTRGFIKGLDEWCISVAIIEAGRPVAGVLECPALGQTFTATAATNSAINGKKITVTRSTKITNATGSHKINKTLATSHSPEIEVVPFIPSLAYRIALVAAGKIDLALARPGAHDWDLAAVDLILANAGGKLVDLEGCKLRYDRQNLRHEALIACSTNLEKPALELANCAGILH
jgi:myo-inositol-1(or 4)-monophosphatase